MRLRATRTLYIDPQLPEALANLGPLARNLYWTWNTDAASLFERLDPELWEETSRNPVALLQRISTQALEQHATDPDLVAHLDRAYQGFRTYMDRPPLHTVEGTSSTEPVAYFSLEFALTESLPNYSGGLGVLAGDHLKAASDLGISLVGVGLLYHEGYFRQELGADGWQHEEYRLLDLSEQPLQPVMTAEGERLRVEVPVAERTVLAQVWRLDVGKVALYLLDTNFEANTAEDRNLTARLYGGDADMRIQQEIVLGIGGVRVLRAMGLNPAACHMNEGHSSLLGLERIRTLMEEHGASFDEARLPVTAATAFTTHTAVAAGIDLFPPELVTRHLGPYATAMGVNQDKLIGTGRTHPDDSAEPFSMAMVGLRLSGFRNGVSKLHGTVSKRLWESAWPAFPLEQVPIESVTNGVHLTTWVSHEMGVLFDRVIGPWWRDDPVRADWSKIHQASDEELWAVHERQRARLLDLVRQQNEATLISRGLSVRSGEGQLLDPSALTIGFARRFASYKRATLLFRDPARLAAILNREGRPLQFLFAGKAHPRDEPGKALIREVVQLSHRPEFRGKLLMLERYDVGLARPLVQGCDIWLNTPLRPLEASGTSGMKACANGGIHVSVLDGWWWEAYRPGLGWAVGRHQLDDDPEVQDAFDANSVYDLLEGDISDAFYERDEAGIPRRWVGMMKASIEAFAPRFNTSRMVAEYADRAYTPAARSWRSLRERNLGRAREVAHWLEHVRAAWPSVAIEDVTDGQGEGSSVVVTVCVNTGELTPTDLRVDAIFGPATGDGALDPVGESPLALAQSLDDGKALYRGEVPFGQGGRQGYAIRLLPTHPDLPNPFTAGLAHWA